MRRWRQASIVAMAAALAWAVRSTRLSAFAQHQAGQHYEDIYYLPDATWLPVLSLGFEQALADLIWCKSLVYFGNELSQRGAVQYVFSYTDAILALDPSFRAAYRWIATAALYRPTDVSFQLGLRGASYLQRAVERWPEDGELRWDYGSFLRFELAPMAPDARSKRELLERAAPELTAAARLGAGPPWLALNNAQLLDRLGQTDQAIRQLEEMHALVQSDDVKRDIEAQLGRLKAQTYIEATRAAIDDFEARRVRTYPYLSPGLFLLIGEPRSEADLARFDSGESADASTPTEQDAE